MSNPSTTLSLTSSAPPAAVQSVANRVHVIGPCSAGPLNTPTVKNRLSDFATNGYGPGVSCGAEVFSEAATNLKETGLPVFFTRSATSTPSTLGTMVKTPASVGTPLYDYGQIKLAGADQNGDLFWQAVQSGVSLAVVLGGALANAIVNKAITLTIPAATTATAVAAYWNGVAALTALATISAHGTGASNAGTTLTATQFDAGNLTFTALDNGYSVEVLVAGNNTALSHSFGGVGNKTLTINLATDANGEPTSTADAVLTQLGTDTIGKIAVVSGGTSLAGAKAVTALVFGSTASAVASGTPTDRYLLQVKAARSGALGAVTVQFTADEVNPEDRSKFGTGNASLYFQALRSGLAVKMVQQTGISKALTHTFAGGLLTVNLGTDGAQAPSTTASALRTYLALYPQLTAAFRFNFDVGDGSGIMAEADRVDLTAPSQSYSGELLVPASGIVQIKDSKLDTGVTLTFTGVLEQGDRWVVESTLPQSSAADMLTALNAVLADAVHLGGMVVFVSTLDAAGAALFDTQIQAALQTRQMIGVFGVRGIGEGVANETHDVWQNAITLAWLGFVSVRGLLSRCAGEYAHVDSYTGRVMRRPWLFGVMGRAASAPYHQDLGRTLETAGSGSIKRCLGLYHDEAVTPGLGDQRFITATSAIERPGAKFITYSPSSADQSDTGYSLMEYPRTVLVGLRVAKLKAFDLRASMFPTITEPDSTGAPAGALTPAAAASMEEYLGKAVFDEWNRKKSDGQGSIGPLPEGVKVVEVHRTNVFSVDRTVNFTINCPLLTPAFYISIAGNAILNG